MPGSSKRGQLTIDNVRKCAALAKIKLDGDAEVRLATEIGKILDYFEQIKEVETGDVEPTYSVLDDVNRYREDRPEGCLTQEEATANAGEKKDGYFKSPKAF
jgi:aspartyl-tRNA(Asn)/glutamyl-tRNA(Gln) amidotransferase subunit C